MDLFGKRLLIVGSSVCSTDVLNKEIKEDIRGATAAAHLLAFSSCCANLERY